MGGTSQRYFTPGSYPPTMSYYPPVSLYPTPNQFHRYGVMPPIPGSSSNGPAPLLLPPNAHPPPVVVVPHGWSPIRPPKSPESSSESSELSPESSKSSLESSEPSPKPVVIPPPVILQPPQPRWQAVETQTSFPPHEGSPTHPPRARRSRSRSRREPSSQTRLLRERPLRTPLSRTPSPREPSLWTRPRREPSSWTPSRREPPPRTQSSHEQSLPVQRVVDSDADSYSPPSQHLPMKPLAVHVALIPDFRRRSPSPPVPPLPPRRPEIDEAPQLNVSATLARPASSFQPNPNSPPEPLRPAQRPVDSDVDSYSAPSPHLREEAVAAQPVLITDFPQRSPPVSPLSPRRPEIGKVSPLSVSVTLTRPTSSVQSNPNSPQAQPPRVQRPVVSDANSYSAPSPHLHMRPVAQLVAPITGFRQHSPSYPPVPSLSPRRPEIDEAPQLNVSTTLAPPASSVQPNPNSLPEPLRPAQRPVDSDADSYSAPSPHLRIVTSAATRVLIPDFLRPRPSSPPVPPFFPRRPEIDETPQLNVSALLTRTTSSVQSNLNSPRAPPPQVQRPVDLDADSYSAPSPHFWVKASARRSRPPPRMDSSQSSPSRSPRKPAADEEPKLNDSMTLARPTSSAQPNPNSLQAPPSPVQRAVDSDANSYSAPSPHLGEKALAEREAPSTDSSPSSPSGSPITPAADEDPQLNVSTTLAPGSQT